MGLLDFFWMGGFHMPVGPEPDLKEIEYLSAIHQSGTNPLRSEGTISSADVRVYLRSRYGIDITEDESAKIVRGLGGTLSIEDEQDEEMAFPTPEPDEDAVMALALSSPKSAKSAQSEKTAILDDNEYLDIVQLIAILMIPTLQRAKRQVDIDKGILKIEPIPESPDTRIRLAFTKPRLYHQNRRVTKELAWMRKEREFHDSLDPTVDGTERNVISMVLKVLLAGIGMDSTSEVIVNKHTVAQLLEAFGFPDLSENDVLIAQMVHAAGGHGTILDELSLAKALTSDVELREVGIEDALSETFMDVYGCDSTSLGELIEQRVMRRRDKVADRIDEFKSKSEDDEDETAVNLLAQSSDDTRSSSQVNENQNSIPGANDKGGDWVSFDEDEGKSVNWFHHPRENDVNEVVDGEIEITPNVGLINVDSKGDDTIIDTTNPKHIATAPSIDYVVDEYKSIAYLCFVWMFYIFGAAAFMGLFSLLDTNIFNCEGGFVCKLVQQVWTWLVFGLMLSIGGLIIVLPLSLGNDPHKTGWRALCASTVSFVWALAFGALPYILLRSYVEGIPHSQDNVLTEVEEVVQQPAFRLGAVVFFVFGCLIAVKVLMGLPSLLVPEGLVRGTSLGSYLFVPASTRSGANTKQAATKKINGLIDRARSMHFQSQLGRPVSAMDQYLLYGKALEPRGGFFWTMREIVTGRLVKTHGIWLPSNLLVGQEGQVFVLIFALVVAVWGALQLGPQLEQQRKQLESEPPSYLRDNSLYFTPYPKDIYVSFSVGIVVSALIGTVLISLYIPSTVDFLYFVWHVTSGIGLATVLKLRSGAIETLSDPGFGLFRTAADVICYNVGNMIYALVGSTGLFFILSGGVAFLLMWLPTRQFFIDLIGWGLGLGITIGLKMIITMCARAQHQQSLYRRKPRAANVTGLCLMCWNIALGSGVMFGRIIQFLLAAAFWTGRVDAVFLDKDVNLFGYSFDYVPINFRKDILVTEAHRHPWLDRIGGIYMMRQYYGSAFGSNAGARWRQLFCAALMPWIQRYRKLRSLELVSEFDATSNNKSFNETEEESGFSPEENATSTTNLQYGSIQANLRKGDFMGSF